MTPATPAWESPLMATPVPAGCWYGSADRLCGRDSGLNAGLLLAVSIDLDVGFGKNKLCCLNAFSPLSHVCGVVHKMKVLRTETMDAKSGVVIVFLNAPE